MKIGMDGGRLVALHGGRWFAVGAEWGDDVLAFLADGTAAVDGARALIEGGGAAEAGAPSGLPFAPQSVRHFSFWESHMVNAGRQTVAQFMPRPAARFLAAYERVTGKPHRAVRPRANFHRHPQFFMGNHRSVVGDGAVVGWPSYTSYLDFELEVAAVVTAEVRDPSPAEAAAAIGGYLLFNDWTARDTQFDDHRNGTFGSMVKSKTFQNSVSAVVVTADEFRLDGLLDDRAVSVSVNDEVWVEARTGGARYTHADALVYAAGGESIRSGDVLASGTVPMCCGLELDRYPGPGDVVRLEVEGLGALTNTVGPRAQDRSDRSSTKR
jgi:2-keto-4-pentenoate hydratase/2-oxohepta-3-ene-1,7-dioic acid hydratase in catechol pathway